MQTSQVPERFQVDPLDAVAYDRWMDAEGLLDASPGCREAWAVFRAPWRAERDRGLTPAVELRRSVAVPNGLMLAARGRPSPRDGVRWLRLVVRLRCPDMLRSVQAVLAGEHLDTVAERDGISSRLLRNTVHVVARWWLEIPADAT